MKHIKLFESFKFDDFYKNNSQINNSTKEECIKFLELLLKSYHIYRFIINDDLTVDVNQSVSLTDLKRTKLPFKFGKVYGNFNIGSMGLITLDGSPYYVDGSFICADNNLIDLKGSPSEVTKHFVCQNNRLESLEGMPLEIGGDFVCYDNTSLKELDSISNIEGNIYCDIEDGRFIKSDGPVKPIDTSKFNGYCKKILSKAKWYSGAY